MTMSERAVSSLVFVQSLLAYRGPTLIELRKVNVSADKAATHHGGLPRPTILCGPLKDR